jgi:hypothetical protein
MSASDATLDPMRLAALSRRLGIPARQLVVAAARLAAHPDRVADRAYRESVLRDASAAADTAARLVLTPIPDYSINELETLFASIWPGSAPRRDA